MKIIIKDRTNFDSIFGNFSIEDYYRKGDKINVSTQHAEKLKSKCIVLTIPNCTTMSGYCTKYFSPKEFREYIQQGTFIIVEE